MKWIAYTLSVIGMTCIVAFLNMITPEDNLIGMGFGSFVMQTVGFSTVFIILGDIIFDKNKKNY